MLDYNLIYKLVLLLAYSIFATWVAIPYVIKKCKLHGYMVRDWHKIGKPKTPVLGGVAIWIGILVSLALSQLLFLDKTSNGSLFIFYFIVLLYGMYGILDDIFHFKIRYSKIIVLVILSIPIASLIPQGQVNIGFTSLSPSFFLLLLLGAIYVMFVSNLINIHAGFNGLGPGTTLIMLVAAGIKSYMMYGFDKLIYLMPILGGVFILFLYNKYPAKVFDGNVGAFLMGSALGAFLIVNDFWLFGLIILIPHIITFILDTLVLGILKVPDKEFPKPRKDGLIIPDKTMRYKSLKNIVCTLFRLTEGQATNVLLLITAIFCFVAVMWI